MPYILCVYYSRTGHTEKLVREMGYEVILVDTSEFRKIDGGLSCLSLRFRAMR